MQGEFSYASQPHAAPVKRAGKYRDENEDAANSAFQNLMHDPRVVRGNTYSAKIMSSSLGKEGAGTVGGKTTARTLNPAVKKRFVGRRVNTPPPVDGRVHMTMQTEDFLEELSDRPIEVDAETQTHTFMDRPATPLFVRAKTGRDIETQIMPGDLFDFDLEVEPILEVLVGKTLHVSMLELMQEEELEAIKRQQEEFEAVRNVELAEVKRLEAEARRKQQEKDRRTNQEQKRIAEKKELEEKIAARSFAYQYLSTLHNNVFELLEEEGYFYDPLQKEVEDVFMKDMIVGLKKKADAYEAARAIADELIEGARLKAKAFEAEALRLRQEMYDRIAAEEAARLEKIRLEEEEKARLAAEAAAAEAALENAEGAPPAEE
jgi:hypothetical protein